MEESLGRVLKQVVLVFHLFRALSYKSSSSIDGYVQYIFYRYKTHFQNAVGATVHLHNHK